MILTLEDPRAQIKGSRDPLGVQALWASFGRHVVGNLTTVTSSVRNFTVLLLGRHFSQHLIDDDRAEEEDALSHFLRWEQIAAYVRHLAHGVEGDIRGIERVKRRISESDGTVPIGLGPDEIILSDQKTYGLWGLYTVAARVSGLLPDGLSGVTPDAQAHLEAGPLTALGRARDAILDLVRDGGELPTRATDPTVKAVTVMLGPELSKDEAAFYGRWLRDGAAMKRGSGVGPEPGRQGRLARLLVETTDLDEAIGRDAVLALAKAARSQDEGLATRLERISLLEAFLAPAEALFEHLLARRTRTVDAVAEAVLDYWGARVPNLDPAAFADLLPEIDSAAGPAAGATIALAYGHLARGEYAEVLRQLVVWNGLVMGARGGAPWVVIQGDLLDVRYSGQEVLLPERDALPSLWRNTYFLDSLRLIAGQLEGGEA